MKKMKLVKYWKKDTTQKTPADSSLLKALIVFLPIPIDDDDELIVAVEVYTKYTGILSYMFAIEIIFAWQNQEAIPSEYMNIDNPSFDKMLKYIKKMFYDDNNTFQYVDSDYHTDDSDADMFSDGNESGSKTSADNKDDSETSAENKDKKINLRPKEIVTLNIERADNGEEEVSDDEDEEDGDYEEDDGDEDDDSD